MARILVVEDNPDSMALFRAVLGFAGHTIVERPDGEGLLVAIAECGPDLVLMDIQLPGKDGFALLEEVRAAHGASVRVVALTAHAMGRDRDRAREAGFDGYITKPIDVRAFPGLVARALAGEVVEG